MAFPSIPGYTIVKKIAEGGSAEIFKARKQPYDNDVALKVLHLKHADNRRYVKAFEREAAMLERLEHPNIIKFYRSVSGSERPTMELELFDALHIKRIIQKPDEFDCDVGEKCRILNEVCKALEYCHSLSIAHKDIKPENILLSRKNNKVKLIDFSIATEVKTGFLAKLFNKEPPPEGTPTYLAPEQILAKNVDTRCDIYSMGVVAYQFFSGKAPLQGKNAQALLQAHLKERPPSLKSQCPDLPKDLIEIVDKCLYKDPSHRPQEIKLLSAVFQAHIK